MTKSSTHWYPRYTGDIQRKTSHLSMQQMGAYDRLLDWYYSNSKPLPLERVQMHRICNAVAPNEQADVDYIVDTFFERREDGYHNDKANQEILKRLDISKKRRLAQLIKEQKRAANDTASAGANAPSNADTTTTTTTYINPLPPFVDFELFSQFIAFRKEIKKPLTPTAEKVLIQKLEKFDKQGYDVNYILRESITNRWQGVFEPKNGGKKADKTANMKDPFADLRGVA